MNKTIGILAHVDAGKTTLSEQILYHCGAVRRLGRVDHSDTLLDHDTIEKRRGITVFSDAAGFQIEDDNYYLIDTPGHLDFQAECERVLPILDYAVLLVSGVEMVQSHTENLYRLLKEYKIPVFLFINKADREGFCLESVLSDIKKKLGECVFIGQRLERDAMLPEELQQAAAELDEELLEQYLEERAEGSAFWDALIMGIKDCRIMPAFAGSALKDLNIELFLHNFHLLTRTLFDTEAPFLGKIFRVYHEPDHTRVAYIKCLKGRLRVREEVEYSAGGERVSEKTNQLRIVQGSKYRLADSVEAGMVFAVTGISKAKSGQSLGMDSGEVEYSTPPVLKARVEFDNTLSVMEVLRVLKEIEDEEPIQQVEYLPALSQIQLTAAGVIQLEVVKELCADRYGLIINFGECGVVYKETLESSVVGYGHYEPLRHYAEVHLRIEPGDRGSGIVFCSACSLDVLGRNWQNLIEKHIFERKQPGVLTGSELTDVKITLLAGRDHLKHTEGGDFREAVYRAIRQGLRSAECRLLEPYYDFSMKAESSLINRILSDIIKMQGIYDNPVIEEGLCKITGRGPVSRFYKYYESFQSLTKGSGRMNLIFGGYELCHDEREAIERTGYEVERDYENPAGSIFCSHGAGYEVKWDEACNAMHIKQDYIK